MMARRDNVATWVVASLAIACVFLTLALVTILQSQSNHGTRKPSVAASTWAALSAKTVALERCGFEYGVNDSGNYNYEFTADVTNNTRMAIDRLIFYVRSRDPQRTVPVGESIDLIEIRGGIEAGESRTVKFHASFSHFGNYDYPQPPSAPFEVAIVDDYPSPPYTTLYKHFSGLKMLPVTGDYTRDRKGGEDGFLRDVLELKFP